MSWDCDGGPEIIPLWECELFVVAQRDGDFVEFDLEDPEDLLLLAHSEQGLIAHLFFFVIEDLGGGHEISAPGNEEYLGPQRLSEAVGFKHLDEVIQLQKEIGLDTDCEEKVLGYTRALI